MLFSTSGMFKLHVVLATVIMFNILELIMKIVPNYPTLQGVVNGENGEGRIRHIRIKIAKTRVFI
jgi:hypothetical protein